MESIRAESEVRFTGITTFNDLLLWNLQLGLKRWVKFAIALLIIIVISVVGNTLRFPANFSWSFLRFMVVSAAAVLIFIGLIIFLEIIWNTKRYFNSGKALRLQTNYTANKDGIRSETVQSNSLIRWDQILSVAEIKPMFILYVTSKQAFLFPKRYFNNDQDISSFKKILISEIMAKKLKLRKNSDVQL